MSIKKRSTIKGERGAALVEYALLVAMLVLVAVTGVAAVGEKARNKLYDAGQALSANAPLPCEPGVNPDFPNC